MASKIEQQTLENRPKAAHNGGPLLEGMRLKNLAWMLCAIALLAAPVFAQAPAGNGRVLYKWVDADGVTHYGDIVPPEYAAQERHVMNSRGVEISLVEAQKTSEQLAAEEKKKRDAEQAENRDKNLLNTYVSVQEIERLRDQRLTLLADQIKVTNSFLEQLDGRMKKLRSEGMNFKPYSSDPHAPPMPDQVAEDLVRLSSDIRTQEQNLRQKRGEEAAMSIQFESDIDRFKELKHLQ